MDQGTNSLLKGFSDSLNSYLGGQLQAQQTAQAKAGEEQIAEKKEAAKQQAETDRQISVEKTKSSLEDVLTPDMAEKVLPGGGAQMVQQYNAQNPNKPLKLKDGVAYLKQAADALNPDTSKEDNHQDMLFQQGKQAIDSIRGDKALQEWETKRDGAKAIFNTIEKVKSGDVQLSKAVYYDMLGQMWKARNGASPTDQAIKDLDQKTLHGDISKAANYFTGFKPGASATTAEVLQNLQDFARDSGFQADKEHAGYMTSHMTLNPGLNDTNKKILSHLGRGLSFGESTGITKGLSVGDVKNGHTYIGGDPGSKSSWEKK